MKKTTKVLSVIMAAVMLFAAFSIVPSALTAKQVLDYYEGCVAKSAKKSIVFVDYSTKYKYTADFTSLSGKDLKETKEKWGDLYNGEWDEYSNTWILHGGTAGYNEIEAIFTVAEVVDDGYTALKSATKKKNADGTFTVTMVVETKYEEYSRTSKHTALISSKNLLMKLTTEESEDVIKYSVQGNAYPTSIEGKIVKVINYNDVPAKKLELSQNEITLGYNEAAEIGYKISPDNVSFDKVYCENADSSVVRAYEEDGVIHVIAQDEGTAEINVYTYSGNLKKTITVTVKYTFFDKVRLFFDSVSNEILVYLALIFFWL